MDTPAIPKQAGRNMPGLANRFYAAERDWFNVVGVPATPTTYGDQALIVDAHTFLTGKGFVPMYSTLGENELKAKRVGARDSKGFVIEYECFIPGNGAAIAQWLSEDKEFIFEIQDADCTVPIYYQMGSRCISASIEEGEWSSGKALDPASRKGWIVKLMSYMSALTKYTSTLTLYP